MFIYIYVIHTFVQIMHVYVKTKSKKINEEKTINPFNSNFIYLTILYLYTMCFDHVGPPIFSRFPHDPLPTSYPLLLFSSFYNPSNLSCSYIHGYEAFHLSMGSLAEATVLRKTDPLSLPPAATSFW